MQAKDETSLASIPKKPGDFMEQTKSLKKEDLHHIAHELPLRALETEWLRLHDKLSHMLYAQMDEMVKQNLLPNKFDKLKRNHFMCPLRAFGKTKNRARRNKGTTSLKYVIKKSHNKPGMKVLTDQIVVQKPGLVPQLSGRYTHERICGATCFIDHYSKLWLFLPSNFF